MLIIAIALGADTAIAQTQLEEIVVTATKRAQSTQDIPMSVEAMSGEKMSQLGIRDMADLSNGIPSFIVTESAGDRNITMRGMGSPAGQRGIEQAVAMYVVVG